MTAPDVRTAAQAEAERLHRLNPDHMRARVFFVEGAVWGAALVTPTREQIAEAIAGEEEHPHPRGYLKHAEAVLALLESPAKRRG